MPEWSPQQANALDRVGEWLQNRNKPFFQLAGYAGTGKTTLAKHLAASVDGLVCFAAPTGKAAQVLAKSGAPNVSTIHKLIYKPKDKSRERLKALQKERDFLASKDPVPLQLIKKCEEAIRFETSNLSRPMFALNTEDCVLEKAALLVVDEYSMIDKFMKDDLLSFGCPILALGDPFQLPPVKGPGGFSDKPDIMLTDIQRQAADNPIIRMSMDIRNGNGLRPGQYGSSIVHARAPSNLKELVLDTDQLLVGKNTTRLSSNNRVRELSNRSWEYPEPGDKLVCLRNNAEHGLINGQIWKATAAAEEVDSLAVMLRLQDEDGRTAEVLAHKSYFQGGQPDIWTRKDAEEFDYGYALTVHKSQGSQWDDVLLFDEWKGNDYARWLYTGVTRAAEKITVVAM